MKSEVYSWRVSSELKSELEREARLRNKPLSAILDVAVRDWLKRSAADISGDEEQRRLHEAASNCVGVFAGRNPRRSENAREAIQARLRRRRAR
jgi:predicted transcriptional regulator